VLITRNGKLLRPKRLPSNLFQFRAGTGEDRCVLDCITSLQNGADLLWIETEKPHIEQIAGMVTASAKSSRTRSWSTTTRRQLQLDAELPPAGLDAWKPPKARTCRPMTAPS
jgi:hypothetical protein